MGKGGRERHRKLSRDIKGANSPWTLAMGISCKSKARGCGTVCGQCHYVSQRPGLWSVSLC